MLKWILSKVQPLKETKVEIENKVETKKETVPFKIKEPKWIQDPNNYWLEIDANFQLGRLFPEIDLSKPVDLGSDSRMQQVAKRWYQRDRYKFSRTALKFSCEYEAYIRYIFDLQNTDIEIDHFEEFMVITIAIAASTYTARALETSRLILQMAVRRRPIRPARLRIPH